jgi:hypothetical protein
MFHQAGRFSVGVAIAAIVLLTVLAVSSADAATPACGDSALGTYAVVSGATTQLAVWRHQAQTHEIPVSIDGCTLVVDQDHPHKIGGFVHEFEDSAGHTIPSQDIGVEAVPTGKTSASVYLTLKTRKDLAAGRYSGTLQLDNAEQYGHSLSIPATITLQYEPLWIALLIPWLFTLTIGTLAVYLKYDVADQPFWARSTLWPIGAAIAASIGVWKTQYLTVGSWGGSLADFWGLIVLMLSAYIAAGTTVSLAGDKVSQARGSRKSRAHETKPEEHAT